MATEPRLTADFWVRAYLRRLELAGIPAYVTAHGDDTAGAGVADPPRLGGRARARRRPFDLSSGARVWVTLAEGAEPEMDAAVRRQRGHDPDLWVIEIEDRQGRSLLDEPGLGD